MSISVRSSSISKEAPITLEWLVQLIEQLGPIDSAQRNKEVLRKLQAKSSKYKFLIQSTDVHQLGDIELKTSFGAIWDGEKDGHINLQIGELAKPEPQHAEKAPEASKGESAEAIEQSLKSSEGAECEPVEPEEKSLAADAHSKSPEDAESQLLPQESEAEEASAAPVAAEEFADKHAEAEAAVIEDYSKSAEAELIDVKETAKPPVKESEEPLSEHPIRSATQEENPVVPERPSVNKSVASSSSIPVNKAEEDSPSSSKPKPAITMLSVYWLYVS